MKARTPRELTTVSQVAEELGVSRQRVNRVVQEYKLKPWFSASERVQVYLKSDFSEYKKTLTKKNK